MTKKAERIQARELRKQGYSLKEIARKLNVAKSSVSIWCRDIKLTDEQKKRMIDRTDAVRDHAKGARANKLKWRKKREAFQEQGREQARHGDWLHLAGCMLYWAEGAKKRGVTHFANSDPNMIELFMRFLRESLNVPEHKLRIRILCYLGQGLTQEEIENYWLNLLNLDRDRMQETGVNVRPSSSKQKGRILKYGVCHISVGSIKFTQQIYGAIQEYGGFENPDWLD